MLLLNATDTLDLVQLILIHAVSVWLLISADFISVMSEMNRI